MKKLIIAALVAAGLAGCGPYETPSPSEQLHRILSEENVDGFIWTDAEVEEWCGYVHTLRRRGMTPSDIVQGMALVAEQDGDHLPANEATAMLRVIREVC